MTQTVIIFLLLLYIVVRESFFLYSTHKFINKFMSHSFYDYQQAVKTGKAAPASPKVQPEEEPEEDLGRLQGIGIL